MVKIIDNTKGVDSVTAADNETVGEKVMETAADWLTNSALNWNCILAQKW